MRTRQAVVLAREEAVREAPARSLSRRPHLPKAAAKATAMARMAIVAAVSAASTSADHPGARPTAALPRVARAVLEDPEGSEVVAAAGPLEGLGETR